MEQGFMDETKVFSDSKARQNTFTRSLGREVFTEIDKNLSSQNQLMTVATILRVGFARFRSSSS